MKWRLLRLRYIFCTHMLCPLRIHFTVKPLTPGRQMDRTKCSFCGATKRP